MFSILKARFSFAVILVSCFFVPNAVAQNICHTKLFLEKVSKIGTSQTIEYAVRKDDTRGEQKLHLRINQPVDKLLSGKRPALIFIHPGAFIECGNTKSCFEEANDLTVNPEFTSRGFVTVSVEYRLSKFNPALLFNNTELVNVQAKAIQDVRDAVKYVFDNADKFNIDKNYVFLAGHSAGAIAALHAAFLDQRDLADSIFKTIENLAAKQPLKGVISISGSIYSLDFIKPEYDTPTLLIHGKEDFVVPFGKGKYGGNFFLSIVYGSGGISDKLKSVGHPSTDFFSEHEGHDFSLKQKSENLAAIFRFIRQQFGCADASLNKSFARGYSGFGISLNP